MHPTPTGLELERKSDGGPQISPNNVSSALARVVYAANDASNLTLALTANLNWMSQALNLDQMGDDVRLLLRDAVAVSQQLTQLLGGAIGCCRDAVRPKTEATRAVSPLRQVVDGVLRRVSNAADSIGVLLLDEGPDDVLVAVDADVMRQALETLLLQALTCSRSKSVVRISYARCGGHAVIGVTNQGHDLTPEQLARLTSTSHFDTIGEHESRSPLAEVFTSLSRLLLEQGGYVDVELAADEMMTVFLVVPAADASIVGSAKSGTAFAEQETIERGGASASGQKRSETMIVNSDRFGVIEVDTDDVLSFPTGIVGFPTENEFVLIRKADSQMIGWLQSTRTSYLTLPVVSAHVLAPRYPDVSFENFAERAGLGAKLEELAVLVVLSAPPGLPATVNLMAPIIVNAVTRMGAQVLLEGTRFSTRELFVLPAASPIRVEETAPQSNETEPTHSATTAAE